MFLPHHGRGPRPPAAAWLHPWVKAAHARSRAYRANPDRPRVRGIEKGVFRDISTCEPPTLQYGDVVGIVFTVTYAETPSSWSPIYMLSDIIRVAHANREFYPLPATDELVGEQPDGGEYSVAGVDSSELLASRFPLDLSLTLMLLAAVVPIPKPSDQAPSPNAGVQAVPADGESAQRTVVEVMCDN